MKRVKVVPYLLYLIKLPVLYFTSSQLRLVRLISVSVDMPCGYGCYRILP